jgi:uncharacterized CHY-type Zn-finger protein
MITTKSKREVPIQIFNGRTYYQYEGRYFTSHNKKMHRDVWSFYNGEIPKGHHIHHIDGDVTNNDISNLQLMEASKHLSMEAKKRHKENPEWSKQFHAKGIEMAKEWHKSPEGREWHKQHGIQAYAKRKPISRICQKCQKQYETTQLKNPKFCSNNCKSAFRKASGIDDVKRICGVCSTEFTANKYTPQTKCKRGCKK